VTVTDQGIGIEEVNRTKVFERFFRINDPRVKAFPGMGLGLYISTIIVRRHGGTIGLSSRPGKGSAFYFTLPYHQAT
jgi:signal transduction histidine kinase